MTSDLTFNLAVYSRALDEIYLLRRAFSLEAGYLSVSLDMKTFPKSRRHYSENLRAEMLAFANGDGLPIFRSLVAHQLRWSQEEAGTVEGPTVISWLAEPFTTRTLPSQAATAVDAAVVEAAVAEIRMLRTMAARFAMLSAIPLEYASYPKTRRPITEGQMRRLTLCAQGRPSLAYAGFDSQELHQALPGGLTRSSWEAEAQRG